MPGSSSTSPAGAVTAIPGGGIRQHGDPNPELNSSPIGDSFDLQAGDLSAAARRIVQGTITQPATDVQADRADIGTE
jgi:hypothetical protein